MPLVFFLFPPTTIYQIETLWFSTHQTPPKKIYKSSTSFKTIFRSGSKVEKLQGSPFFSLPYTRVEIIFYFIWNVTEHFKVGGETFDSLKIFELRRNVLESFSEILRRLPSLLLWLSLSAGLLMAFGNFSFSTSAQYPSAAPSPAHALKRHTSSALRHVVGWCTRVPQAKKENW